MGQCPTPDAGAVGDEVEAAVEFTGGGTVGGGRFGGEKFGEQSGDFGGPVAVMIAAGQPGRPGLDVALSAGFEVVAVESVEVSA
jgi:hypothetical protein